ncbi:MAG TPA: endonuclease/exonuclease/phosphatase family protein [Actinomycetales bacterium]
MSAPLRFGSFNLLSGRSMDDGTVLAARLHEAVAGLDVDVLAVQEVDRDQQRSGRTDQLAVTAQALGAVAGAFAPALHGLPGPGRAWRVAEGEPRVWTPDGAPAPADGPSYGVGLVSRWPVLSWQVRRFPAARGVLPLAVPGERGGRPQLLIVPEEPRVALAAVVSTPRGPVTVISTHLSFIPFAAARQLRAITRWASSMPGPRLLLGDLNLPGPVPARLTRWQRLARTPTFPAASPRLQLDHALGHGWEPGLAVTVSTPRQRLSDHRPLLLHLG